MNIYVLLKQTFDTEEKVVTHEGAIVEEGAKFVINPYDEYAVEEALRISERHGGKVTVVSVGPERCAEALRTALAMGADEAVLITDSRIGADEYAVAEALAAFLSGRNPELVLGGNFSVDNGAGQVAVRLAQRLGLPHIAAVTKLEIGEDGKTVAHRDAEGDVEIVETTLPALITAQQGLNEPRYPSLPGIMKAKKKPLQRLTLDDLEGLPTEAVSARTERTALFLPPPRKAGKRLTGEPAEQAQQLVRLLRDEAKALQ